MRFQIFVDSVPNLLIPIMPQGPKDVGNGDGEGTGGVKGEVGDAQLDGEVSDPTKE